MDAMLGDSLQVQMSVLPLFHGAFVFEITFVAEKKKDAVKALKAPPLMWFLSMYKYQISR